MPDERDENLVPPLKVMRKRMNGVYRADSGFSGPTRRYVLIVALLVGLASVPTLAAITAGSTVLSGGRTDTMDVPFLPPASPGPVQTRRPARPEPSGTGSHGTSPSPTSSASRPGTAAAGPARSTDTRTAVPSTAPPGSAPPDSALPGATPAPVQPPVDGPSPGTGPVIRTGPIMGQVGRRKDRPRPAVPDRAERMPGTSAAGPIGPAGPPSRHAAGSASKHAAPPAGPGRSASKHPAPPAGSSLPGLLGHAGFPSVPGFPALPGFDPPPGRGGSSGDASGSGDNPPGSDGAGSGHGGASGDGSGSDGARPGRGDDAAGSNGDTPSAGDDADDPPNPDDDPVSPADPRDPPSRPDRPVCHERGRCGSRPSRHHRPDFAGDRPCADPTRRAPWSRHRTVHADRSSDRSELRRRSAVTERPYNVRSAGVLEHGHANGGYHGRRFESRADDNQLAARSYHGHHRAAGRHQADYPTPAEQRSSRVGRHHADPHDGQRGRW